MGRVVTSTAEAVGQLEQSPSPGTLGFIIELSVDTVFIIDLVFNLRTSYVDTNGFREDRPKHIFRHYVKRWFVIDLISCLPLGYVQLAFVPSDEEQGVTANNRLVKGFRLLKLAKMLRLGRDNTRSCSPELDSQNFLSLSLSLSHTDGSCSSGLRKLALKHGAYIHWQQYIGVAVLLFTIFLLIHLLACFFYLIGDSADSEEDGV